MPDSLVARRWTGPVVDGYSKLGTKVSDGMRKVGATVVVTAARTDAD